MLGTTGRWCSGPLSAPNTCSHTSRRSTPKTTDLAMPSNQGVGGCGVRSRRARRAPPPATPMEVRPESVQGRSTRPLRPWNSSGSCCSGDSRHTRISDPASTRRSRHSGVSTKVLETSVPQCEKRGILRVKGLDEVNKRPRRGVLRELRVHTLDCRERTRGNAGASR